jgi:hypothetical protein
MMKPDSRSNSKNITTYHETSNAIAIYHDLDLGTILKHVDENGLQLTTVAETAHASILQYIDDRHLPDFDLSRTTLTSGIATENTGAVRYFGNQNKGFWRRYKEWGPKISAEGISLWQQNYERLLQVGRKDDNGRTIKHFFEDAANIIKGDMGPSLPWRMLVQNDTLIFAYWQLLHLANNNNPLASGSNTQDRAMMRYMGFSCIPNSTGVFMNEMRPEYRYAFMTGWERPNAVPLTLTAKGNMVGLSCMPLKDGLDTVIEQAIAYRREK